MLCSSRSGDNRYLPSFPTRRSSDLTISDCAGHIPATRGSETAASERRGDAWRSALSHRRWLEAAAERQGSDGLEDRKSTRLNSSHSQISYAVFCLKKKTQLRQQRLD